MVKNSAMALTSEPSRRDLLRLAAAGLIGVSIPDWALPALAQGESLVSFTDYPDTFKTIPNEIVRFLDLRTVNGPFTPKEQFFTTQHYGQPQVDPAMFRLKVT